MRRGVVTSDATSSEEARREGSLVLVLVGFGNDGVVVGLVVGGTIGVCGSIVGSILHAREGCCRCRADGMGRTLHVHKGTVGDESISISRGRQSRSTKGLTIGDARAKRLTGTIIVVGIATLALGLGGGSCGSCLHLLPLPPRSYAALERRVGIGEGCAKKVLVVDD